MYVRVLLHDTLKPDRSGTCRPLWHMREHLTRKNCSSRDRLYDNQASLI